MEEENSDSNIIAEQGLTDEMRIQFAIDKFYETTEGFNRTPEQLRHLRNLRNNIINMMDTYLKKFQNQEIMDDFYKRLAEAKDEATINGEINKYHQYMNEIRVIQELLGIRENIAYKLADSYIQECLNTGEDLDEPRDN